MEEKILYHYTNAKGLMGILESQCLWATDFRYTNDSSEIQYARELMEKTAKIYADLKDDIWKNMETLFDTFLGKDRDILPFVFSVCDDGGDRLSQWRGYGREGGGYSIGLSSVDLDKLKAQEMKLYYYDFIDFDKVSYGEIPREFEVEFHEMLKFFGDYPKGRGELPEELNTHAITLIKCLCRIKHSGFEEEKEYRLTVGLPISYREGSEHLRPIKFRLGANGIFVPYIELFKEENSRLPIKEIVVGPSRNIDEKKSAIELLQNKNKLDIAVRKSNIPYKE
jgi:hypothetical protein